MKLGKHSVISGKNSMIFFGGVGGGSTIFSQIGKVHHLNLDFSAYWECFRLIGNFFSHLRKNWVPETGPVLYREKSPEL